MAVQKRRWFDVWMMGVLLVILGMLAALLSGCSNPSSPSLRSETVSQAQAATVTVTVLDRGDQISPVLHVSVYVDQRYRGETDAKGEFRIELQTVPVPLAVDVRLEGWKPMGADAAEVRGSEQWTFYLQRND